VKDGAYHAISVLRHGLAAYCRPAPQGGLGDPGHLAPSFTSVWNPHPATAISDREGRRRLGL